MDDVGALIFFALLGALICARARVAGGAVVFALLALALFVSTPAGAQLPGAIADVLSTIDDTTTPALTDEGSTAEPAGAGR